MMRLRGRLTANILSLVCLQAVNYAAPLITLPYLARVLQPTQFGLLSFAQGIVLYFDFLTDFGFNYSATREIATSGRAPELVTRIFWTTFFSKVLLMSLSALALTFLVAVTPKLRATPSLFAANALYLVGTTLFPVWLFQGLERMTFAVGGLGIGRLLTIPAIFLLVRGPHDYVIAAAIQASVELTAGLIAFPLIFRRMDLRWYRPSLTDLKQSILRAWPLFLSGSALFLCSSSTTVILGSLSGEVQVAYFSAADKLIKACTTALNPLTQAFFPYIAGVKRESPLSALKFIRTSLFVMVLLSSAISTVTFLVARPLCEVFLGASFRHSGTVLQWLSPLPFLYGLINVFGTQTMLVFNMDKTFSRIIFAGALAGLPVTAMLSRLLGAKGAALGSVTTAVLVVVPMLVALRIKGLHIWKDPALTKMRIEAIPVPEPE
jgi:polysaccharide transporter, PST family